MEVICSIKGVKEDMDGTQMLIQAKNANVANYIIEHCISIGRLVIMDGRFISPEQRKKAYATERDIAEYCGYMSKDEKAYVHEALKRSSEQNSNAPVSNDVPAVGSDGFMNIPDGLDEELPFS